MTRKKNRRKEFRRAILITLWSILVTLVGLELILRFTDPWGVMRAYNDLALLHQRFVEDAERGYVIPEGEYKFSNWTATMIAGDTRLVPDTNPNGSCTIAMIGDSLTFGQGVNDDETFTNLLARQFPDVYFINAGINGYNIGNALMTIQSVEADAYIYYLLHNDVDPPLTIGQEPTVDFALPLYVFTLMAIWEHNQETGEENAGPGEEHVQYPDRFTTAAQAIASMDNVQIVGTQGSAPAIYVQTHYDATVQLIPRHGHRLSRADPHPNPVGHARIAQSLLPIVERWIAEQCPAG